MHDRRPIFKESYPSANITDLKRMPESILIKNGSFAYMVHPLSFGDVLTVHIRETAVSEKIPPVYLPLDIVYEDEDLMVVNKPADLPIHPSMNNYTRSLGNGLAWYFKEKGQPFAFRCINRLDHNTSGLTIIAKHLVSGSILATMVRNRRPPGRSGHCPRRCLHPLRHGHGAPWQKARFDYRAVRGF